MLPQELSDTSFFLGGYDLEMVAIRELLDSVGAKHIFDHRLSWGAKASAYRTEIEAAIADGHKVVLIELIDDLPPDFPRDLLTWIDHHGDRAGRDRPTSIEQVFRLLGLPPEKWTRHLELVAANDRGHIAAMERIGASLEEMREIRLRDRRAQGVTEADEAAALEAITTHAEKHFRDRLIMVQLPHNRSSTVTDALDARFGGAGYRNLLVFAPGQMLFFGSGRCIAALRAAYPDGWYGGELPIHGYWGINAIPSKQDILQLLEMHIMTKSSHEIPVRKYRQILIWPLLLRGEPAGDEPIMQRWAKTFEKNRWKSNDPVPKKMKNGDLVEPKIYQVPSGICYEEIVYFHPFVRDFLFGDGKTEPKHRSIHQLIFDEVKRLRITYDLFRSEDKRRGVVTLQLTVDRVELYLCKPNVALFVVEVSSPERPSPLYKLTEGVFTELKNAHMPNDLLLRLSSSRDCVFTRDVFFQEIGKVFNFAEQKQWGDVIAKHAQMPVSLAEILDFQDQFRRIYPPFWYDTKPGNEDSAVSPGLCPISVEWLAASGDKSLITHNCTAPAGAFREFTFDGAEPPVFDHWKYFFGNIKPFRTRHDLDPNILCYQQIMDERIPAMVYLGVDDPKDLSDGDLDRLTSFDPAGTDDYPYQKEFLDKRREHYCYDRFWQYGTRYMCSGYGFTVLGKADNGFFGNILQGHFRAHYFRLGLLAHFLRAALLGFADELAEVVKILHGPGDVDTELAKSEFRNMAEKIQLKFLKFRSRSWFPEVTNQRQGGELHKLWFSQLNIEALFKQVDETSLRLHQVLSEYETRQLARAAQWGLGITIIIAAAAAVFGFAGLCSDETKKWIDTSCLGLSWPGFWFVIAFVLSAGLLFIFYNRIFHNTSRLSRIFREMWRAKED